MALKIPTDASQFCLSKAKSDTGLSVLDMSIAGVILIAVSGLIAGAQKIGGFKKLFNR